MPKVTKFAKLDRKAAKHRGTVFGLVLGIPLGAIGHWAWSAYGEWLVVGGLAILVVLWRRKKA